MDEIIVLGTTTEEGNLLLWCPGCKMAHHIKVGDGPGPRWTWNGNMTKPTFSPSLLVTMPTHVPPVTAENLEEWKRAPWVQTRIERICHSFIADGQIQFLNDCTHELAGQTVPLPDFEANF